MSMMPPDTELGYAPPMVHHFSVFLDNRVGKLLELLGGLSDEGNIEVRAISILDSSDYAVIRLLVDKPHTAREILQKHEFAFCDTDVLVAELGKDHELHHLCKFLLSAELNIHFAYPTMPRPNGHATVVLSTDDNTLAGQVLRRKGFRLLGEADLEI
ncbi:MAG: acetolactate synthase [Planctomycetota bacterium]